MAKRSIDARKEDRRRRRSLDRAKSREQRRQLRRASWPAVAGSLVVVPALLACTNASAESAPAGGVPLNPLFASASGFDMGLLSPRFLGGVSPGSSSGSSALSRLLAALSPQSRRVALSENLFGPSAQLSLPLQFSSGGSQLGFLMLQKDGDRLSEQTPLDFKLLGFSVQSNPDAALGFSTGWYSSSGSVNPLAAGVHRPLSGSPFEQLTHARGDALNQAIALHNSKVQFDGLLSRVDSGFTLGTLDPGQDSGASLLRTLAGEKGVSRLKFGLGLTPAAASNLSLGMDRIQDGKGSFLDSQLGLTEGAWKVGLTHRETDGRFASFTGLRESDLHGLKTGHRLNATGVSLGLATGKNSALHLDELSASSGQGGLSRSALTYSGSRLSVDFATEQVGARFDSLSTLSDSAALADALGAGSRTRSLGAGYKLGMDSALGFSTLDRHSATESIAGRGAHFQLGKNSLLGFSETNAYDRTGAAHRKTVNLGLGGLQFLNEDQSVSSGFKSFADTRDPGFQAGASLANTARHHERLGFEGSKSLNFALDRSESRTGALEKLERSATTHFAGQSLSLSSSTQQLLTGSAAGLRQNLSKADFSGLKGLQLHYAADSLQEKAGSVFRTETSIAAGALSLKLNRAGESGQVHPAFGLVSPVLAALSATPGVSESDLQAGLQFNKTSALRFTSVRASDPSGDLRSVDVAFQRNNRLLLEWGDRSVSSEFNSFNRSLGLADLSAERGAHRSDFHLLAGAKQQNFLDVRYTKMAALAGDRSSVDGLKLNSEFDISPEATLWTNVGSPEKAPVVAPVAAGASTKPDSSKPTASKPTASKPTASKPTASKPTASKPTASKPTASKPTASKPTAPKPTASKHGDSKSDSHTASVHTAGEHPVPAGSSSNHPAKASGSSGFQKKSGVGSKLTKKTQQQPATPPVDVAEGAFSRAGVSFGVTPGRDTRVEGSFFSFTNGLAFKSEAPQARGINLALKQKFGRDSSLSLIHNSLDQSGRESRRHSGIDSLDFKLNTSRGLHLATDYFSERLPGVSDLTRGNIVLADGNLRLDTHFQEALDGSGRRKEFHSGDIEYAMSRDFTLHIANGGGTTHILGEGGSALSSAPSAAARPATGSVVQTGIPALSGGFGGSRGGGNLANQSFALRRLVGAGALGLVFFHGTDPNSVGISGQQFSYETNPNPKLPLQFQAAYNRVTTPAGSYPVRKVQLVMRPLHGLSLITGMEQSRLMPDGKMLLGDRTHYGLETPVFSVGLWKGLDPSNRKEVTSVLWQAHTSLGRGMAVKAALSQNPETPAGLIQQAVLHQVEFTQGAIHTYYQESKPLVGRVNATRGIDGRWKISRLWSATLAIVDDPLDLKGNVVRGESRSWGLDGTLPGGLKFKFDRTNHLLDPITHRIVPSTHLELSGGSKTLGDLSLVYRSDLSVGDSKDWFWTELSKLGMDPAPLLQRDKGELRGDVYALQYAYPAGRLISFTVDGAVIHQARILPSEKDNTQIDLRMSLKGTF